MTNKFPALQPVIEKFSILIFNRNLQSVYVHVRRALIRYHATAEQKDLSVLICLAA